MKLNNCTITDVEDDLFALEFPCWQLWISRHQEKYEEASGVDFSGGTIRSSDRKFAAILSYVILAFVGLAALGSSVTAYEVFFKDSGKKCESHKNGYNERTAKPTLTVLKERKSVTSHGNILF
ncbi:hypothetical protein AVEN_263057-1 [Araneus ventricosus]|uniref:Uncharacterized protein n=1 Tax=Araneus ventricosus TaxID=182803 RepID=A0A4Y2KIW4_ARAVE|nr:hypothetical protein AVEN_263057-1 [Araneus ventricosus]